MQLLWKHMYGKFQPRACGSLKMIHSYHIMQSGKHCLYTCVAATAPLTKHVKQQSVEISRPLSPGFACVLDKYIHSTVICFFLQWMPENLRHQSLPNQT